MDTPTERTGLPVTQRELPFWIQMMILCVIAFFVTAFGLGLAARDTPSSPQNTPFTVIAACEAQTLNACANVRTVAPAGVIPDFVRAKTGLEIFEPTPAYRELGVKYVIEHGVCVVGLYENGEVQISLDQPAEGQNQLVVRDSFGGAAAQSWTDTFAELKESELVRTQCTE